MPTISLSTGKLFQSESTESVLEAASRSQVALPYSCRTGRCSTCKCKVVSGISKTVYKETGLSDAEKADGWILSCVRTAETDLVLEVDEMIGDLPVVKTTASRISSLERLAADVMKVTLRLPPAVNFEFFPGQYIDVIGSGGVRRSYSLASASNKVLELHIRSVPNGAMSTYWFEQAVSNDLLRLNGPLGTFFLREVAGLDLVFLATGTGIAPVKAMLEGLVAFAPERQPRSVTVYWGGRTKSDLYWDPAALPPTLQYHPVLSRADATWTGRRGHVQDALVADCPDFSNTMVYACGSDAMIHGARSLLTNKGLASQRFHSDAFVCSAAEI
jgi:CDP-4-dehydro-6-deoxyglucose reductase